MAIFQTTLLEYAKLNLELVEVSVDQANNTSSVKVRLFVSGNYMYNGYPHTAVINFNGTDVKTVTGLTYDLRNTSLIEWYSGNWTVPHTSNGTGAANVKVTVTSTAGDNVQVTGSLTLTPIIVDKPMELSTTSITLGEAFTLAPNLATGETADLKIKIGSNTEQTLLSGITGTQQVTIPLAYADQFPGVQNTTATLSLIIKKTGVANRTETATVQLIKPANAVVPPTVGSLLMEEKNTKITSGIGAYWVAGQSVIYFSTTAKGNYGAMLSSATLYLQVDGVTTPHNLTLRNGYVDGTISNLKAGNYNAWITVKDSNGEVGRTANKTFNVLAYSPPSIASASAVRNTTTNTTIDVSAIINAINFSGLNTLTFKLYIKPASSPTWNQIGTTQTSTTGQISYTHQINAASVSESYQIKFEASDELVSGVTAVLTVASAMGVFDFFEDKALGVGKLVNPAMPYNLQVAGGGIQSDGNIETEGVIRIGRLTLNEDELRKIKTLIS